MTFFIILLLISQIVRFYLILSKRPILTPKTEGGFLKKIPDKPTYESLDPENKLVYEIMESIKLEGWEVKVETERSYHISKVWTIEFKSKTGILIRSRLSDYSTSGIFLASFSIINSGIGGVISVDDKSKICNDVIIFLWNYVIEYYQNENEEDKKYYQSTIDDISSKLKTVRRSEKLNNILEL